jgi:hypothetical protein
MEELDAPACERLFLFEYQSSLFGIAIGSCHQYLRIYDADESIQK